MTCLNCQADVSGKFCPHCGQRTDVKRITLKEGWFDFWSRVYGFDGMFPRTLRDLTIRPGTVAREYIRGNRVKYYGPVGYFFLMITVLLLVLGFINIEFIEMVKNQQSRFATQQSALSEKVIQFVSDNLRWVLFLGVPFQAYSAKTFFFRKSGYNFLEHMVLLFYTAGHLFWLTILIFVFYKIFGSFPVYTSAFTILFFGYSYSTFIDYQSRIKSFLKGMGVYFMGQVLFVSLIVIILLAYILLLAWLDPESLKIFKP